MIRDRKQNNRTDRKDYVADQIDLSENSKARLFKALRQNFDICGKTQ
jgi:hypothetical protein